MKLIDWVPSIPEVFEWVNCRLVGHDWDVFSTYRLCKECGKYEELK